MAFSSQQNTWHQQVVEDEQAGLKWYDMAQFVKLVELEAPAEWELRSYTMIVVVLFGDFWKSNNLTTNNPEIKHGVHMHLYTHIHNTYGYCIFFYTSHLFRHTPQTEAAVGRGLYTPFQTGTGHDHETDHRNFNGQMCGLCPGGRLGQQPHVKINKLSRKFCTLFFARNAPLCVTSCQWYSFTSSLQDLGMNLMVEGKGPYPSPA